MAIVYGANYGAPTLDLNFARNKSLIDTVTGRNLVTFTRSSAGTYVGADGLIKSAAVNEARFDHNPVTGESLGLLVEEARTNLALNSETLGSLGTYGAGVITPNFGISPSGLLNARRLSPGAGAGPHGAIFYSGNAYAPNGWQISVYVKPLGLPKLGISIGSSNWGSQYPVSVIDFDSLTFTANTSFGAIGSGTNQSVTGQSVTNVGNGWYRVVWRWVYEPNNNATMSFICGLSTSGDWNAGQASWNFDGTPYVNNGFLIWGIQIENAAFPTSYIPTTGSTVTRSADNASITGTNFTSFYNQTAGTIFTNVKLLESTPSFDKDYGAWFGRGSNSISGIRHDYSQTPTNLLDVYDNSGNLTRYQLIGPTPTIRKAASAIQSGSFSYCLNGTLGSLGTAVGVVPTTIDRLLFGGYNNSNGQNKTISRFTYYPSRLQDFQLQQLTR